MKALGVMLLLIAIPFVFQGCKASVVLQDSQSSATVTPQVTSGLRFNCAINRNKKVVCWGANPAGQLGIDSSGAAVSNPTLTGDADTPYSTIDAGYNHVCGITEQGKLKCWGENISGQLGNGFKVSLTTPTPIDLASDYSQVSAGSSHTCGIQLDGKAKCWGSNLNGELGDNSTTDRVLPTEVSGSLTFRSISAGNGFTCGVTQSNDLYCWGLNSAGQLGDPTYDNHQVPFLIDSPNKYKTVAVMEQHACAITTSDKVKCWGQNPEGELGDGSTIEKVIPGLISDTPGTYSFLTVGMMVSCGITLSGSAKCWGKNTEGQIQPGTVTSKPTPDELALGQTVASISSGDGHTCAVRTDKILQCWGLNHVGQLGQGDVIAYSVIKTVNIDL